MMTLEADRATVLDESAHAFMATFIAHVSEITGEEVSRLAIIARVKVLLLAALAGGDGAASAWNMLHRTVVAIVAQSNAARNTDVARAYLRSFITENQDLDHD